MDQSEPLPNGKKGSNCDVVGNVTSEESMDASEHEVQPTNKSIPGGPVKSQLSSCEYVEGDGKKCDKTSSCEGGAEVGSPISEADEVMEVISDAKENISMQHGDGRHQTEEVPPDNSKLKPNDNQSSDSSGECIKVRPNKEAISLSSGVPHINCPEKIIICIDLSTEMNQLPFKFGNGSKFPPISMVKRVIEIFVQNKSRINKKHEYALVALHEKATWVKGFSSDPNDVCYTLDNFNNTKVCSCCELSSLFKLIPEKIHSLGSSSPPSHVVRVILIYGRSNCIPKFHDEVGSLKSLKKTGCFFFDVLYIHEPASTDNKCQEVFESFCDLDETLTSYVFEVTRNTTKLHNCMAKLLSHPLQRPFQKHASYKL